MSGVRELHQTVCNIFSPVFILFGTWTFYFSCRTLWVLSTYLRCKSFAICYWSALMTSYSAASWVMRLASEGRRLRLESQRCHSFFFGIQKKSMRIQVVECELTAHEVQLQSHFVSFSLFFFCWTKSFGSVVKGLSLMTITYGPAQVFHWSA